MLKRISIISLCFSHLFTQAAWAVDVLPVGSILPPPILSIVFGPNVVTDPAGLVTTLTYGADGNLVTTTDPLGNTTTLNYDTAGNVIRSTDAEGNVTNFTYDTMNRLIRVVDAIGGTTSYT